MPKSQQLQSSSLSTATKRKASELEAACTPAQSIGPIDVMDKPNAATNSKKTRSSTKKQKNSTLKKGRNLKPLPKLVWNNDNMKETIFGKNGISKEHTVKGIQYLLKLEPFSRDTKHTKHKNFVRNMINLLCFVHHSQQQKFKLTAMNDKGCGYVPRFEKTKPNKNDVIFQKTATELYLEATNGNTENKLPWCPKLGELLDWSGNMNNFIYTGLRICLRHGLYSRNEEEIKDGMFKEWNDVLELLGIVLRRDQDE